MNAPTFILCNFKRSIYLMLCFRFGLNFVIREVLRTIKTFKTQFQFRVSDLFSAVPPAPSSQSRLPFCFATSASRLPESEKLRNNI